MFSKACEYALRATIFLARKSSVEKKLSVDEIAGGIDAPRPFVAKVLQQLNREAVILSAKGPNGGFYLSAEGREQPVLNVLVAFGEEQRITGCVMGLHKCNDKKPCPLHEEYREMKGQLLDLFRQKKISELADALAKAKIFVKHQ